MRVFPLVLALVAALLGGPAAALAAKVQITGMCVCKKGSSVLNTYSSTLCLANTHDNCTAAKKDCVTANAVACTGLGGKISQSTKSCTYGAKC